MRNHCFIVNQHFFFVFIRSLPQLAMAFSTAVKGLRAQVIPMILLRIASLVQLFAFTMAWPIQYGPWVLGIEEISRTYFVRKPPYTIASNLHIIFPVQITLCYFNIIYSTTFWPGWGYLYLKTVLLLGTRVCSLTLALIELIVTKRILGRLSNHSQESDPTIREMKVDVGELLKPLASTCVAFSAAALLTKITVVVALTLRLPKRKRYPRNLQPVVLSWSWGQGKKLDPNSSLHLEETGRLASTFQAHERMRAIRSQTKHGVC
jgi:hypothetical protein